MEKNSTRGLGWSGRLGMVDTIFEEDEGDNDLQSSISSPPYSSPSTPDLPSSVESWSQVTGRGPDVKIHVQGECFWLHKEVVTCKSGYLKRKLQEGTEVHLSPPLKVTVEAFKLFAEFCYQCDVVVTPFNLAPLRTALELLHLSGDALRHKVDSYFSLVVALNPDLCAAVFLSSLSLLPEAEHLASLPSRCLEALCSLQDSHGGASDAPACADCVKAVQPGEFQIIADSMHRRLDRDHDLLYRIVDLYLKVYEGKISEEQKTGICNSIDCCMLSPQLLMHAVQNPRMPLRFIVQAMLIEQLNTRRAIFSSISCAELTRHENPPVNPEDDTRNISADATTLGALLQRDAALRQVTQLREAMDTTTSRIHSLEKELSHMKARLIESEKQQGNNVNERDLSGKSASCRFSNKVLNKVERGERGSVSSSNLRFNALPSGDNIEPAWERSFLNENATAKNKKNIGNWLMRGLKSAFRVSSSGSKKDPPQDVGHLSHHEKEGDRERESNDTVEDVHNDVKEVSTHPLPSSHHRRHSLG